jgi:ABC-2 type transport system permease protein
MNTHGIWAIYRFEMARALRTLWQSLVTPVLTTSLYFIVFGGAIGSRMQHVGGVDYGSFIVPGLIMLSLLTQSISTRRSASTSPNSPARSTNSCPRPSRRWRW